MPRVSLYPHLTAEEVRQLVERVRSALNLGEYAEKVRPIVEDVAARGWEAVREYTRKFDGVDLDDPRVPRELLGRAYDGLPDEQKWALEVAVEAVRRFNESVTPVHTVYEGNPGVRILVRAIPLRRVACYAPGGEHPYPSTVYMTAVPARAAGVEWVAVTTPPRGPAEWGYVHPLTLAAAYLSRVDAVYRVGGAQAVAAFAFGAEPYIPRVDKIVGPGSPYVVAAKLLVSPMVGVDMLAGPSEVVVVAGSDAEGEARSIALDLLAQAEHGPLSVAVLLTTSGKLAKRVLDEMSVLARDAEHLGEIHVAIASDWEAVRRAVDELAPEHLELVGGEAVDELRGRVSNAGAVAVRAPVALTDYSAGPSHVLPTSGTARWRGGLMPHDFVKLVAEVELVDPEAARDLARAARVLAEAEGFRFHADSLADLRR